MLSLVLMSKGCSVVSLTLFKIGSEADVWLWWSLRWHCCLVNYILCKAIKRWTEILLPLIIIVIAPVRVERSVNLFYSSSRNLYIYIFFYIFPYIWVWSYSKTWWQNSEVCFPLTSMFPSASPRETLKVLEKQAHCFPWGSLIKVLRDLWKTVLSTYSSSIPLRT